MRITLYTTERIFNNSYVSGGVKRFLELYLELIKLGKPPILCSADDQNSIELVGRVFFPLKKTENKKHILPKGYHIYKNNWKQLKRIKEITDNWVVVFDVPNCIGLVLARVPNIVLFIRQDLIGYRKIYLKEAEINQIKRVLLLILLWVSESLCFIKVRKIHVQCRYDLEIIKSRHKILANTIERKTIIQINNVNPSWIVENRKKAQALVPQPFFNNGYFTLAYVGDFSSNRKGYSLFITVLKKLLELGYRVNAILVGKGSHLDECKDQFRLFHENVVFTGWVNNPSTYIKQSHLCVVPSFEDSCPNTILEALYNKIPVIGANRGGIPEILADRLALFEPTEQELFERILIFMNEVNYNNLLKKQLIRKRDLSFNWAEKVLEYLNISI